MSASDQYIACPQCGEDNPPERRVCWLCQTPLIGSRPGSVWVPSPVGAPAADQSGGRRRRSLSSETQTSGSLVVLMLALAVVCLGVLLLAPGLGIIMAILLIVPLVRTSVLVKRRAESGRPTSRMTSIGLFVASTIVQVVVLCVVGVAAFATFCLTCFGVWAATGAKSETGASFLFAVIVAGGAALVVVVVLGRRFYGWVRSRWDEDLKQ